MKKTTDVEALFNAIEEDPNNYREIVQTEDANKSLGRWSLISAIHQMDHSKEAKSMHAKPTLRTLQAGLQPLTQNGSQTMLATEVEIEIVIEEKSIPGQPLSEGSFREASFIKTGLTNNAINALIVDTAHINVASSQSINSLFARLNRS
jgi:hypothetical protein